MAQRNVSPSKQRRARMSKAFQQSMEAFRANMRVNEDLCTMPHSIKELAQLQGISYNTMWYRLRKAGYPLPHALMPTGKLHTVKMTGSRGLSNSES